MAREVKSARWESELNIKTRIGFIGEAEAWKCFKKELCKYPEHREPDRDSSECKNLKRWCTQQVQILKGRIDCLV